jgi:hypothetical protein
MLTSIIASNVTIDFPIYGASSAIYVNPFTKAQEPAPTPSHTNGNVNGGARRQSEAAKVPVNR